MPNIVHYVLFSRNEIQFSHFVSILSVLKNQRPNKIYIHCDCHHLSGQYFTRLQPIVNQTNTQLIVRHIKKPTEVFGHKIREEWQVFHGSDLTRIRVLLEFGGVYLDRDVYVVKALNEFFKYDFTLDFQKPYQELGTQVLIARKNAKALHLWLETYRSYDPNDWYYNAR